ncbi:MAG: hypothetical protein M1820_006359 [Bogoriella megaspora]|nr:MAG: hypothetical protein M1820_006359 [Bogoriella megaspora]
MTASYIILLLSTACAFASAGTIYNSTFTFYGVGDERGDGTCNSNTAACGFYTNPGFSAAVSQNLYGAPPGAGSGPICGTCWRLNATTNPYNNRAIGTSIIVKVNNLCPASGNPLCAQSDLSDSSTNQFGGVVDFNLCRDDGASAALFGDSGTGLAVGSAEEVDCGDWKGTVTSAPNGGGSGGGSGNTGTGDTGTGDSGNYDSGNYDCGDYDSGNYDGCDGNGNGNGTNGSGSGNGNGNAGGSGQGSIGNSANDNGEGFIGAASALDGLRHDFLIVGTMGLGSMLLGCWLF